MPRRTPRRAPDPEGTVQTRTRPTGRPPVVADRARVNAMLEAVRAGVPVTAAIQAAGMSWASHQRAMEQGAIADEQHEAGTKLTDRQELYRAYRAEVNRARAQTVAVHVGLVAKAALGGQPYKETTRRYKDDDGKTVVETEREFTRPDWRASKFLLQTGAYREEFAERAQSRLEVTGEGGGPVEVAPAEEALRSVSLRLHEVFAKQAKELPGGWDPDEDDGITDAELVDE